MYFSLFFVTILLVTASKGSQELASPTLKNTVSYNITNLWNGTEDTLSNATDKGGNQVTVKLQDFANFVRIEIDAPFYNDPPPPNGKPGEPYDRLYNYEVAETFFLCKNTSQYVELEFGAHGEHLVLFLNGRRNDIMKMLPLNYTASIDQKKKRWSGQADVPADYFPPNVTHFNAYAIHNQQINGSEPIYKALYPSSGEKPDFHDLDSFKEFSELHLLKTITDYSDIWKEALSGGSSRIKMSNEIFYFFLILSIIVTK